MITAFSVGVFTPEPRWLPRCGIAPPKGLAGEVADPVEAAGTSWILGAAVYCFVRRF